MSKIIDQSKVFRWSPEPLSYYCGPGSANPWLRGLSTTAWNLAWMALDDPKGTPAPKNFREDLAQSLGCKGLSGSMRKPFSMEQVLSGSMSYGAYIYLSTGVKWVGEKPRLLKRGWKTKWDAKSRLALMPDLSYESFEPDQPQPQPTIEIVGNILDAPLLYTPEASAWLKDKGFLK